MKCEECPHQKCTFFEDWDCECELQQSMYGEYEGCRLSDKYLLSLKAIKRVEKLRMEEAERWERYVKECGY